MARIDRFSSRPLPLMLALAVLAGCVYVPRGPSIMVMPGRGKSFERFEYDDVACRDFAASRVDPDRRAANDAMATSAVVGTAIGAAAGAALGAAAGDPGTGAAVGAGVGLLGGTAAGANEIEYGRWTVQQRYDAAYAECMYARGNRVPVPRGSRAAAELAPPPPPRSRRAVPPPPPGRPPPPPYGAY